MNPTFELIIAIVLSCIVFALIFIYLYHMAIKFNLDNDSYSKFVNRIETNEISIEEIDDQSFKLDGYLWTIVASQYALTKEFMDKYSDNLDILLLVIHQRFTSNQIMELIKLNKNDYDLLDAINQYQELKPHVQARLGLVLIKHKPVKIINFNSMAEVLRNKQFVNWLNK